MPLGANKSALLGMGGVGGGNYFGDGSLGNCQFGASSITQTGDTAAIDTVLTTGSESGGPGSSSYGDGVPNSSACYEVDVQGKSGSYDGDMWVGNFKDLTIDASVTFTTDQPCRGMLLYVDGDCTINGALSMIARGGLSDPTASGGSDSSAVSSTGLRLAMFTASGTDTLAAADFAGCGNGPVAAVANQAAISGDGTIFTISKAGGAGGAGRSVSADGGGHNYDGNPGSAGTTGGVTLSTGGGGTGGFFLYGVYSVASTVGAGGAGGAFSGGAGSGGVGNYSLGPAQTSGTGGDYGGAGGNGAMKTHDSVGATGGGAGNPGGTKTSYPGNTSYDGGDGSGGLIWLIVQGDLTVGSGASITSDGVAGGAAAGTTPTPSGGGTGGGAAMVLYGGTLTNNGSITAAAGAGGTSSSGDPQDGADGGAGGVHTAQIDD